MHVYQGRIGEGGRLLAMANILGSPRPDVAQALGSPFWTASGWEATVPAGALQPGNVSLTVYVHSPSKGWWWKQVDFTINRPRLAQPILQVLEPRQGEKIKNGIIFTVNGYALDPGAFDTTGVDRVDVYIDGARGEPQAQFLGMADVVDPQRGSAGDLRCSICEHRLVAAVRSFQVQAWKPHTLRLRALDGDGGRDSRDGGSEHRHVLKPRGSDAVRAHFVHLSGRERGGAQRRCVGFPQRIPVGRRYVGTSDRRLNRNTDWWRSEQAGRVPHRSGVACDAWHRWREDLEILRALGLNTYRMSVEWARIEPTPGKVDRGALDHYRTIVEAVRAAGVEPIVTLHHFSNPLWLSDGGAWVRRSVVDRFAAYADLVAGHLGDLVTWWVTINEPTVFGLFGYVSGAWPPHRRNDFAGYLRHVRHTLAGHAAARRAIKARNPEAMVSMALHLNPVDPVRYGDPTDHLAVRLYDWLWQGRVLRAAEPNLDWVGVNYYFRILVRWDVLPWRFFRSTRNGSPSKAGDRLGDVPQRPLPGPPAYRRR